MNRHVDQAGGSRHVGVGRAEGERPGRRGEGRLAGSRLAWLGAGLVLSLAGGLTVLSEQSTGGPQLAVRVGVDAGTTARYIDRLDVRAFERRGSDFASPSFSPVRLGIPVQQLDIMRDYDFDRVAELRRSLRGVDRRTVLRHIFATVTKGARTNTERHRAVLSFLQKSSFHNGRLQPLEREGVSVMDPLIVLELGEMHCGNSARLAVDLFESVGIPGRLVQLGGHLVAELHYDGGWHYFDADIFGNGETIVKDDGMIPSVAELAEDPYQIDALGHYQELPFPAKANTGSAPYPSWFFFSRQAYESATGLPAYYEKTADEWLVINKYYGWNHLRTIPDPQRRLHDFPMRSQPGAVTFTRIEVHEEGKGLARVSLAWTDAADRDGDLLGYRVFVASRSRGWTYGTSTLPEHLRRFASLPAGWDPSMYEKLFQLPPHDVTRLEVAHPSADLSLERGSRYFITVMPYDRHGEAVGKRLYQMSDEILVSL